VFEARFTVDGETFPCHESSIPRPPVQGWGESAQKKMAAKIAASAAKKLTLPAWMLDRQGEDKVLEARHVTSAGKIPSDPPTSDYRSGPTRGVQTDGGTSYSRSDPSRTEKNFELRGSSSKSESSLSNKYDAWATAGSYRQGTTSKDLPGSRGESSYPRHKDDKSSQPTHRRSGSRPREKNYRDRPRRSSSRSRSSGKRSKGHNSDRKEEKRERSQPKKDSGGGKKATVDPFHPGRRIGNCAPKCELPSCARYFAYDSTFVRCPLCKSVAYCSAEHCVQHLPAHRCQGDSPNREVKKKPRPSPPKDSGNNLGTRTKRQSSPKGPNPDLIVLTELQQSPAKSLPPQCPSPNLVVLANSQQSLQPNPVCLRNPKMPPPTGLPGPVRLPDPTPLRSFDTGVSGCHPTVPLPSSSLLTEQRPVTLTPLDVLSEAVIIGTGDDRTPPTNRPLFSQTAMRAIASRETFRPLHENRGMTYYCSPRSPSIDCFDIFRTQSVMVSFQ
jgi:hypothetical protein